MQRLTNKQIVLGVTGGIAAYKSAELVRKLREGGANVRVAMTGSGTEFITPLTMQALSGNPVHTELIDAEAERGMGHIELARWADLIVVAPASANFLSRINAGQADDLLATICLATTAPVALAPAMNQAMWQDQQTTANIAQLQGKGFLIWGPASGDQACGEVGPGRMMEPADLLQKSLGMFESGALDGRHVVITAGPTRERIDPVRFISNFSSGKMGFALASAAVDAGARVTLISGPVALETPARVKRINVESAREMHAASMHAIRDADIFVAAAAVADYRPADTAEKKVKKHAETISLELVRNPDILADVSALEDRPLCVGFAAESHDLEDYARAKLRAKLLDMIVANDISEPAIGFDSDQNSVTVFQLDGQARSMPQASKNRIAQQLIVLIADQLCREPVHEEA